MAKFFDFKFVDDFLSLKKNERFPWIMDKFIMDKFIMTNFLK